MTRRAGGKVEAPFDTVVRNQAENSCATSMSSSARVRGRQGHGASGARGKRGAEVRIAILEGKLGISPSAPDVGQPGGRTADRLAFDGKRQA